MGILKQLWERLTESPNRRQAQALTNQAYMLYEMGDPIRAGMLLKNAIEADPTYSHAHSEYALIHDKFNHDHVTAEKHIKIAIQLSPGEPKFWNNLAYNYLQQKRLDEALTAVTVAQTIDPNYASAQAGKAHILRAMGKSDEEIQPFVDKAIRIYEQTGLRSDGMPLKEGDLERVLSSFKK